MAYMHKNSMGQSYYLHSRDVTLRGSGKKLTIYFFARKEGRGAMGDLPSGYRVVESKKTGLPLLKKK